MDTFQSEISQSNHIFITDIARLSSNEKDVPNLDYTSD